jgi:hypothetical protein
LFRSGESESVSAGKSESESEGGKMVKNREFKNLEAE